MIKPQMVNFFVQGTPVPKGSAKAFYNKKVGRAFVVQDNAERQKPWASLISLTAQKQRVKINGGGMRLFLQFAMPRPKSHFKSGRNACVLRDSAPKTPIGKPDLDKLVRCVADALTGIIWFDDSQIIGIEAFKEYADGGRPGVTVNVSEVI